MFGRVEIECLYSNDYHCKHFISRVSVLIVQKSCVLSHSKIKRAISTLEYDWAILHNRYLLVHFSSVNDGITSLVL
jgi:hypothetical protein